MMEEATGGGGNQTTYGKENTSPKTRDFERTLARPDDQELPSLFMLQGSSEFTALVAGIGYDRPDPRKHDARTNRKPKRNMLITRGQWPGPLIKFRSRKSEAASPNRRCSPRDLTTLAPCWSEARPR